MHERMMQEDDFDIDDLLEAPYKKTDDNHKRNLKDGIKKEQSRSRSKSRSREREKKHQKCEEKRRKSRSRSRERNIKLRRSRSRSSSRERSRRRRRSPDRRSRRSRSHDRSRSNEVITRSSDGVTTISLRTHRERELDEENLSQEERDARTVFIMQLARNVTIRDIQDFFNKVGQVHDVRLISDRNSRRPRGIGYVEFTAPISVPLAIKLSGQKLLGIPIMVSPTMAEKNRFAMQQAEMVRPQGPMTLYVGSLHYNITDSMLRAIFEPYGNIENIQLQYDPETNNSKGYGFITFSESASAKKALEQMNGFELAGRPMKVNSVPDKGENDSSMSFLDSDVAEKGGVELNSKSRATLMQKLLQTHGSDMQVPQAPVVYARLQGSTLQSGVSGSTCLVLSNMFDPRTEADAEWDIEYRNDVLEEVTKLGIVVHLMVDKVSPGGNIYLKCLTADVCAKVIQSFNGRWFAGRIIAAVPVPLQNYHTMFPDSISAVRPIKVDPS